MKVIDHVNQAINEYPSLYIYDTYEDSKFAVLHHCFIVLGNGIEWAYTSSPKTGGYLVEPRHRRYNNEWVRIKDKPYGKETCELDPRAFKEKVYYLSKIDPDISKKIGLPFGSNSEHSQIVFESELNELRKKLKICDETEKYIPDVHTHFYFEIETSGRKTIDPYPNFQKQYSCFWEIEPNLIKEDWRIAGIEHLRFWQEYFNDEERVKGYHYYRNPKSFKEHLLKYYKNKAKDGIDWVETVKHDYNLPEFNGKNFTKMSDIRWKKGLRNTKEFIAETLERLEY